MLATVRITAAVHTFVLMHHRISSYFSYGSEPAQSPSPKVPLLLWDLDSHLMYGSLGPHEFMPKYVHDRFTRFCRVTNMHI